MKTLIDKLNTVISQNDYFLDENGKVIKEKIKTSAINMDEKLLDILIENDDLRKAFFVKKENILIFDKVKFSWIISNTDFLPDSFTAYKNKIGLVDSNGDFLKYKDDVTLSFPYKDCVLEFDSTDENDNRDEIFLNETLSKDKIDVLLQPKVLSNSQIHLKGSTRKTTDFNEENLIIKGNNLLVLNSLLNKYEGRIKAMYWDILYNTANDKVPYNDSFKHSSWLTMMKNRLEVAMKLLRNDGVIALQCDDNEQAYLKVLCDEIFGRDNFVNCVAVKSSEPTGLKMSHVSKKLPKLKDYILMYKKGNITLNPIFVAKDEWDSEYNILLKNVTREEIKVIKNVMQSECPSQSDIDEADLICSKIVFGNVSELEAKQNNQHLYDNSWRIVRSVSTSGGAKKLADEKKKTVHGSSFLIKTPKNLVYFMKNGYDESVSQPRIKLLFADDYLYYNPCDFWSDIKTTGLGDEGNVDLTNGKKPELLLKRIIELLTNKDDIILDAYFGTGTTGAVALKLGRKFIGIEQLDEHYEKAITRLDSVINGEQTGISRDVNWQGGGSFISCELLDDNAKYLNMIKNENNSVKLITIFDELINNPAVLNYELDLDELEHIRDIDFSSLDLDIQKKILISLLDKNILYVNKSDIDNEEKDISEADKQFTKSFYGD